MDVPLETTPAVERTKAWYKPWAGRSPWQVARIAIGALALVFIVIEYMSAHDDADRATELDASAIQIVQVWTPHLFEMMTIIGVALALYVLTRVAE